VLNWASARLLLGGQPQVKTVPDASLASIPVGPALGIVGAPDSLPTTSAVSHAGWLACSVAASGGPAVILAIGTPVAATAMPGSKAALVRADGTLYLLWQGHRLRLDAPWIRDALGLGAAPVTGVGPGWLNAVPAGPDLRSLAVPQRGSPGPDLGGRATVVGQVLGVRNVGSVDQFYLVEADGVEPVTHTQAALALTDPATTAAYPDAPVAPVGVSPAVIAQAPVSHAQLADTGGVPGSPPAADGPGPGQAPCVAYPGGVTSPQARLLFATPPTGSPPEAGELGVTVSPEVANQIKVAPGGGALVRPQAAPGVAGNSEFLVTDLGVKFPVPSASAVKALGYTPGAAQRLPVTLLALLPTGPALDPASLQSGGLSLANPGPTVIFRLRGPPPGGSSTPKPAPQHSPAPPHH
jgi:type VII secretion protein EccB